MSWPFDGEMRLPGFRDFHSLRLVGLDPPQHCVGNKRRISPPSWATNNNDPVETVPTV